MHLQNVLILTACSASAEEAVQQAHVLLLYVLESLALPGTEVQTVQELEQTMPADTEHR